MPLRSKKTQIAPLFKAATSSKSGRLQASNNRGKKLPEQEFDDQEPHSLVLVEHESETSARTFPFRCGKKPGAGSGLRAIHALEVFEPLHAACRAGRLTFQHLQPLFYRSTSDLITYREGWKAGRYWSQDAWASAKLNGNTNGLISEHVLPRSCTLRHALEIPSWDEAKQFIWTNSFECVITKRENTEVHPRPGDVNDPWSRYAGSSVQIIDVSPSDEVFLTRGDRAVLRRHGLLMAV
jgi:hypothetical protein